ncbi:sensor histidine kinase [Lutibacter oricola]|uniref:sensor histidine kinase n=1 Tax=Lutibacter oricola TaxID=762486 RepID=UPI0015871F73|nr:sensor histidine kinase [Lutibacter oricola]
MLNNKVVLYVVTSGVFIVFASFVSDTLFVSELVEKVNIERARLHGDPNGPVRKLHFIIFILSFAIGTSVKLVSEWYKSEKLKQQIENQKISAEISFLKTQLNPHFLFNSLNSIYSLANKKSDDTTEAIVTLSELMRYMIYETQKELVPLADEINYIKNYIDLQNLRLKDSSGVRVNIHGKIDHKIEPLLLISFIENAFKYGTDYNGKTDIRICIEVVDSNLTLEVSNYVSIHKRDDQNSGIGLKNVKNRLQLQYPNSHELKIEEEDKRFSVKLKLKLKSN